MVEWGPLLAPTPEARGSNPGPAVLIFKTTGLGLEPLASRLGTSGVTAGPLGVVGLANRPRSRTRAIFGILVY